MRRATSFSTFVVLAALASPSAYAGTINVPVDVPTIQGAIDSAAPGDVVLVAPGTYFENIDFKGKDIEVRSSGGPAVTTIDGGNVTSVVRFISGESRAALIEGFTITNGKGTIGAGDGGGIVCYQESVTGSNLPSSPTIRRNVIRKNWARYGGGIYSTSCAPLIDSNFILDNEADCDGGGLWVASGAVGGQVATILNCSVTGNRLVRWNCGGAGMWTAWSNVTVINSIFWGNYVDPGDGELMGDLSGLSVTYSDIAGGFGGQGNFSADPLFVDPAIADLRLQPSSLCVDAGVIPGIGVGEFDIDGDPRLIGAAVDIGADERIDAPLVLGVSPDRSLYRSPPQATVTGHRFSLGALPTVRFGAIAATNVTVLDDATLTCDVPLGEPGPVDVGVGNAYGEGVLAAGFTYTPALLISGDPVLGGTITLDYLMEPFGAIYAIAGFPPAVAYKTKPYDGTLCIDPFQLFFWVPLWPFDAFTLDIDIPNDPALAGTSYLAQALIGAKLGGKNKDGAWTNCIELTIE